MRRALWVIYGFLWVGGLVSGGVSAQFPASAPLFLAVAGILAAYEHRSAWKPLATAAGLGIVAEWIGVHTGLPFGRYAYTETLGPAVWGVPLAIGFAWLILIDFVRGITSSPWWGALLMAGIDLVIDPLAAGPLGYWRWFETGPYFGIPTLNFVGWGLVSGVVLAAIPRNERRMAWVGWSVVGFFAVLAVEFRLWAPAAIGAGVVLLPGVLAWGLRARSVAIRPDDLHAEDAHIRTAGR